MSFVWAPGSPPPPIEDHSLAKLAVLRSYVSAYIDRLCQGSRRDVFKLDLVDGFSGGGLFRDGGVEVSGTPLIMLEEAQSAFTRLNATRVKPLRFDLKFHFVDIALGSHSVSASGSLRAGLLKPRARHQVVQPGVWSGGRTNHFRHQAKAASGRSRPFPSGPEGIFPSGCGSGSKDLHRTG